MDAPESPLAFRWSQTAQHVGLTAAGQELKRQRTEVEEKPPARSAGRQPMRQGELPASMKHISYLHQMPGLNT